MVDVAAVVGCGGSGHGGTGVYAIVFVSSRMFESLCVCLFKSSLAYGGRGSCCRERVIWPW